uniref:ANK_REP_REGION domain-containing protein n=1 Tax=Elaeophora elaphi TaxID=1147741 RepID=A0A0R3RSQ5_9BILA
MGNRESSTKEEVRKPKEKDQPRLYQYVDIHGGGDLIPFMWQAKNNNDFTQINELIDSKIKNFMYNSGKGKMVAVSELVKIRNKERNAMLSALKRKKGKGKSGPNILDDFNQEGENQGDLKKALKLLEGGGRRGDMDSKYREVVWKLDERGNMGENLVGLCLLQGTAIHNHLARHLIKLYPKLVNDIFISENYYGLSPLHQAIINEDPAMVSFLLRQGANINQRCYGASFCPDDQKSSRTDSLEHEYVELSLKTCYAGRMYFGEYPLSFAACINQTDCFRLLVAKKADLNQKDTNGNTVLHLAVIHEQPEMIKLSYDMGAKLQIVNKQNLTPLTLAAQLGKKEIFELILKLEADVVWIYGNASSHAYPLARIDTISQETGEMNEDSALSLTVYGETTKHLELLDGLLEELLEAKWEAFGRRYLTLSFSCFVVYFIFVFMAFMCRPFSMTTKVRLVAEQMVLLMALLQIVCDVIDMKNVGRKRWWRVMKSFPAKVAYKISFIFIMLIVPIRSACALSSTMLLLENILALMIVLLTGAHFLFYTRALKFIGPFVLMIYTILSRDISRFMLIYSIFLIGFSQSFYVIFGACERASKAKHGVHYSGWENILDTPFEAIMRLFIMTIGEFTIFYRSLHTCEERMMQMIGKFLFTVFELFISIMQFNLLIAMMTRTYETISRTSTEWKRQWAQVILFLELSLKPKERLIAMLKYSRPIGTDKTKRSFVVARKNTSESMSQTEKQLLEQQERDLREEKRALLKRRLKDFAHTPDGRRPMTSYLSTPSRHVIEQKRN